MFLALMLISWVVAGSQLFPKANKLQKFNACYNMLRIKQAQDSESLKTLFSTFTDPNKAESYYTAEALFNCYTTIKIKLANYVIESGDSFVLSKELENYLDVDLGLFKDSDLKTTENHRELYEEIKKIKSSAESKISSIQSKLPRTWSFTPDGFSLLFLSVLILALLFFVVRFSYRRFSKWSKHKIY